MLHYESIHEEAHFLHIDSKMALLLPYENDSQTIYRCCITPEMSLNLLSEFTPGPNSWTLGYDTRSYRRKYAQGLQKGKSYLTYD